MSICLIIQMAGGVVGSSLLAALFKMDVGSWGKSVSGIFGGAFGGQLIQQWTGLGSDQAIFKSSAPVPSAVALAAFS